MRYRWHWFGTGARKQAPLVFDGQNHLCKFLFALEKVSPVMRRASSGGAVRKERREHNTNWVCRHHAADLESVYQRTLRTLRIHQDASKELNRFLLLLGNCELLVRNWMLLFSSRKKFSYFLAQLPSILRLVEIEEKLLKNVLNPHCTKNRVVRNKTKAQNKGLYLHCYKHQAAAAEGEKRGEKIGRLFAVF